MRHRSHPAEHRHDLEHQHAHNDRQHRADPHELQTQVAQLKRVIRVQNQLIIGLSSCFLLVIISTFLLMQHLPHPHDEQIHFWDTDHARQQQQPLVKPQLSGKSSGLQNQQRNCTRYGCPIRPVELTQLETTPQAIALIESKDHILLTHKSNRKKPAPVNQDRAVLIPSFGDDYEVNEGNFFVGLFDGHDDNGHAAAQLASEEIPAKIAAKMQSTSHAHKTISEEAIKEIIREAFLDVDEDVPNGGGCTAIAVMKRGSSLYMANTGDSTVFLAIYRPPNSFDEEKGVHNNQYIKSPRSPTNQLHLQGTVSIHHQNKRHKAHIPEEKERIEALGGRIHIPPNAPMGSRVIVRSSMHREDVGLAMSRSLGDWEWTAVGVVPDPDVVVVDLPAFFRENDVQSTDRAFLVVGSDGLFDARRVEFVANHLAFGLFEQQRSPPGKDAIQNLIDVGRKLVDLASPIKAEWYRDDITFVAQAIECDDCQTG
ncbi:hypothetical protein ACHAXT_012087 [Thalassiosira profunda]